MHGLEIIKVQNDRAYEKWVQEEKNNRNKAFKEIFEMFARTKFGFNKILLKRRGQDENQVIGSNIEK
jgi:hypothetical protein